MNDSAAVAERLHDQRGVDPAPYMAEALDEVTSAVLRTGQWPANVEGKSRPTPDIRLADFLFDQADSVLVALLAHGLGSDNEREAYTGAVEEIERRFRSEYRDSEEVQARAAELAREAAFQRGCRS